MRKNDPAYRLQVARLELSGKASAEEIKCAKNGMPKNDDRRSKKIVSNGILEVQQAVECRQITLTAGYRVAKLPKDQQLEALKHEIELKGQTPVSPKQFKCKQLNENRVMTILDLLSKIKKSCNVNFISKVNTLENLRKLEDFCNSLKRKA